MPHGRRQQSPVTRRARRSRRAVASAAARGSPSEHCAFWEHFARPAVGRVDADLHRWLLEAYALCGRDATVPAPRVTPAAAARTLARARAFLAAVRRHLGLRPPFPLEAAG